MVTEIVLTLAGVIVGALLAGLWAAKRQAMLQGQLMIARQQLEHQQHWHDECQRLDQELQTLRQANSEQAAQLREKITQLEMEQKHAQEKQQQMRESEQRLTGQFENLANRIFESSHRRVDEQNRQSLGGLLTPLREQLDGFRRQVQESFGQEARERHTLTSEIRNLQQLNAKMSQEALNLTRALKGDNKIQGNWGEVVLERVLEASGLCQGREYETQVNIQDENHQRKQPDVIVHLPQGKDVIIDAKMTLVAYERYFNAEDDSVREQALNEHISALRNHIRTLGNRDYQHLSGLRTLDYVLMFIPLEPAFLLAIDRQPELISEALKNNIMLVSPTTLLVALRTIANLWRYEHQNRNAQQIAKQAEKLYNKMRLFVDDMLAVGQGMDKARERYQDAMKKLRSGSGNMLSQMEKFRTLGVEVSREINPELMEQALLSDEQSSRAQMTNSPDMAEQYGENRGLSEDQN